MHQEGINNGNVKHPRSCPFSWSHWNMAGAPVLGTHGLHCAPHLQGPVHGESVWHHFTLRAAVSTRQAALLWVPVQRWGGHKQATNFGRVRKRLRTSAGVCQCPALVFVRSARDLTNLADISVRSLTETNLLRWKGQAMPARPTAPGRWRLWGSKHQPQANQPQPDSEQPPLSLRKLFLGPPPC